MATDKYSSSKSETGYNYTVTQNNPWFGQKYKSYDTNEGGGYHYRQYPDGNFAMFDGHTGEYRLVTDQKQKDYLTNRTAALEQNNNNENQNWFGYTFKPKTSFGQWLGNLKNGGNMTYANYLQEGGQASVQPSSRKEQLKASVIQALQSAKSEDEAMQIMQELQQMAQQDPDAAEVLQELAQEMQGGTQAMKCGGKVKKAKKGEEGIKLDKDQKNILMAAKCGGKAKKTKKCEEGGLLDFSGIDFAKCGKKLQKKEIGGEVLEEKCGGKAKKVKKAEFGSPVTFGKKQEESYVKYGANGGKADCPCKLHRVGGKIVEVDCNGNIVKRK